jgi:hypothetical protein
MRALSRSVVNDWDQRHLSLLRNGHLQVAILGCSRAGVGQKLAKPWRNLNPCTLPVAVFGNSETNFTHRGSFVIRQTRNHKFLQTLSKFGIAVESRSQDHPRHRLVQPILVLVRHNGNFRHGRRHSLNFLTGSPPCTADLKHVVGAAIKPVVTVAVLVGLIASTSNCPEWSAWFSRDNSSKPRKLLRSSPKKCQFRRLPPAGPGRQGFSVRSPELRVRWTVPNIARRIGHENIQSLG